MRKATLTTLATLSLAAACGGGGSGSGPGDSETDGGDENQTPITELGPMTTVEMTESGADLVNPERGYYVGYNLRGAGDAGWIRNAGHSLAIALVNLEDYRERDLDGALLDSLQAGFDQVRAGGIKVVLRFTYNAAFAADASRDRIIGHLDQLAPLLHENADVIAVMQGGFVGAWGEWHGSTNGIDNDADRGAIIDALLNALPPERQVQIRTPMYKEAYLPGGPVDESEAFTEAPRARLGHHNDCFLASADDYGTFAGPEWQDYVAADGLYTAIGGETCDIYPARSSCDAALDIMEAQHYSYLNREYHQGVIAGWVSDGCDPEIDRRLGYRFAVDSVTLNESVAPGGELAVEIQLHNSGFASPFNERPVEIVLTDGTNRHVARLDGEDARRWAAGDASSVSARLRVPADLPPGTYTVAVRLPDAAESLAGDPRQAIQLANDGVWDAATGDNVLTRALVVDPAAEGPRDEGATAFVAL